MGGSHTGLIIAAEGVGRRMGAVFAAGGSQRELVERLLSGAFGAPITIGTSERIEPWFVVRCTISDPPSGVPVTVIADVRKATDGP